MSEVITRFPPSPTGNFHIGSARTALFNYLYAKHHNGKMIFRLEDTDTERNSEEAVASIMDGMHALGLSWDNETIYRQSERTDRYVECLKQLIDTGHAYEAEESNDKKGKVVRFKNPNQTITFTDEVRGDVTFDTTELGDFVIARSINDPLYHLTVVVDDIDMGITHVIRGEDHISNTPRQIVILEALGGTRPTYAHLPLILNEDRSKMSKRKTPTDVAHYINQGFLPEALVNFLALLGWNPGTDQEFFTLDELISVFDLTKVGKSGAIFNIDKLRSINHHYLKQLPLESFVALLPDTLREHPQASLIGTILQERTHIISDAVREIEGGEWDYLFKEPTLDTEAIPWKQSTASEAVTHLSHAHTILADIKSDTFTNPNELKQMLWAYAEEHGKGNVLWPIRYVLTGKDRSPDPFTVMALLGKEATLARLQAAQTALQSV